MKNKIIAVYKIAVPKLKLSKVGYISLKTGKTYKTRRAYILSLLKDKINNEGKRAKATAQALIQAAIFEASKERAARRLKAAGSQMLSSAERFIFWVQWLKSCKKLQAYKISLPRFIKSILF